jgi:hypothetical protein
MKTSELTGEALNWAVEKALGSVPKDWKAIYSNWEARDYSTNWVQGGPIIERAGIDIRRYEWQGPSMQVLSWSAQLYATEKPFEGHGPTPLIAAMRCFVASKLGDEVDIPKELENV